MSQKEHENKKLEGAWAGEMAQLLSIVAALPKDQDLASSTHIMFMTSVPGDPVSNSDLHLWYLACTCCTYTHACSQNINTHKVDIS